MDTTGETEEPRFGAPHVGTLLREARVKAKLELSDIAERTRVPARHLLAIEEARYNDLPAIAYSVGFAKAYAGAVKLDPAAIGAAFRAEANPDPISPYIAYEPVDPARVPAPKIAWIAGLAALVLILVLGAYGAGLFGSSAPDPVEILAEPTVPEAQQAADNPSPDDGDLAAAPQLAPAPGAVPAAAPVVISATEEVWLKIYDRSGQTVRMGILKPGESYLVPGDPNQLLLWTGKAGALQLTVGGKAVAPLGSAVQTVRDISLAPASLLAQPLAPTSQPAAAPPRTGA